MSEQEDHHSTQRPDDYPFLPYRDALHTAVLKLKRRPRHCAVNALRSLRRAWKIAAIDPEMAAFRAITAEEEAATALIFALQHRDYPRANELDWHKHMHKAGVSPFLRAVESMIAESGFPKPQVVLRYKDDTPRVDIFFAGADLGIPGDYIVSPEQPLHGVLSHGKVGEEGQAIATFSRELQILADGRGAKDILAVIRADANLRNQVLYAAEDGVPNVENVDAFLVARRRPVTLLLSLMIAVLQTKEIQLFAVQVLDAYLQALGKASGTVFDYAAAVGPPAKLSIKVRGGPDAPPVATIQQQFDSFIFHLNEDANDLE